MRACYCGGPQPGHTLCPCREAARSRKELEAFQRGIEIGQKMAERKRRPLRDRIMVWND